MYLTVVIPAHNESEVIVNTLKELEAKLVFTHEVIVIDDHSTDDTRGKVELLSKDFPNIKVIDNKYSQGITNALKTGFFEAKGDVIVTFMADLSDDPGTIYKMIERIEDGYDIVCGSRYMRGGERVGGRIIQGLFSRFVGLTIHTFTGIPISDISNAFKMYKRKVLDSIYIEKAGFATSMQIVLKAYKKGYRIAEVPTIWKARTMGSSKFQNLKVIRDYGKWYLYALFCR